jgi:sugar transferase (PEP-CTERM/EpsH1 system associated)
MIPVVLPRLQSYWNCVRGLISSRPLQVHYYSSPRMRAAVAEELATHSYDVAVCHLIRMAQYLPEDASVRTVIDFCDAISVYHERSAPLRKGLKWSSIVNAIEARRVGPYERAAILKADESIFISSTDADYFRRDGLEARVAVVSNGVDLDAFPFDARARDANRVVFVGNMRSFPNTDAVSYFAEQVLPIIQKTRPDTTFYIVGNEPSPKVQSLHDGRHVFVTGRVDSVVPYLTQAAVMVAPMRAVAGVQNKILESLAVGTPVVTTSMGAEGLDEHVMAVADTPEEFAKATLELMMDSNRHRERALTGRAYVENHCTWEKALESLDSLLTGSHTHDNIQSSAAPNRSVPAFRP